MTPPDLLIVPGLVDLLVDAFPALLGPALIFFGLEMSLLGAFEWVLSSTGSLERLSPTERLLGLGGVAIGLLFAASGALRRLDLLGAYVVGLFCLGRAIQGAGTVRFYRQVLDYLQGRGGAGGLGDWVRRGLIGLFLVFAAGGLAVRVVSEGPLVGTRRQSLRLIWTGFVVSTAGLGVARKLSYADGDLPRTLRVGLVLAVAGAEGYNFTTLSLDLAAVLAGSVAFSVGFWVAVYFLFRT